MLRVWVCVLSEIQLHILPGIATIHVPNGGCRHMARFIRNEAGEIVTLAVAIQICNAGDIRCVLIQYPSGKHASHTIARRVLIEEECLLVVSKALVKWRTIVCDAI